MVSVWAAGEPRSRRATTMASFERGDVVETDMFAGPWGGPATGTVESQSTRTGYARVRWDENGRVGEIEPHELRLVRRAAVVAS
jgi:hypothetical protein